MDRLSLRGKGRPTLILPTLKSAWGGGLCFAIVALSLLIALPAYAQDEGVKTLDELMGEVEQEGTLDEPSAETEQTEPADEADSGEVKTLDELMGEVEDEGSVDGRETNDVEAGSAQAAQPAQDGAGNPEQANAPPTEKQEDGMPIFFWLGLIGIVIGMILLGVPLYVLIGTLTMYLLFVGGIFDDFALLTAIIEQTRGLSDQTVLLAIPFFVIAGAIMTEGDIAKRLITVAESCFGRLPGGLAISAVFACAFFAAISGSSPVTVIAIGSIMYPALVKKKYPSKFSMGLVTSGGSLGILIPPSIPMIVYAIVDPTGLKDPVGYAISSSGGGDASVKDLFIAGLAPGLIIALVLSGFALFVGIRQNVEVSDFDITKLMHSATDGAWALFLPVLILGGIYSGIFTPTQAAAVAVIYALVVEFFIHRSLGIDDVPRIFTESAVLMGSLLIIMALALGFNLYLDRAKIPETAVEMILDMELSIITFLLIVNVLLIIVGFFMDILSAILILVPLLAPIGFGLGVHPLHLAIVFIVNLEIGYLTPPIGLNLFVAGTLFKKGLGEVVKSVLPFVALMTGCLLLITYVPTISLGLVSWSKGGDFYVPFPDPPAVEETIDDGSDEPTQAPGSAEAAAEMDEAAAPAEGVKTLDELMGEVEEEDAAAEPVQDEGGAEDQGVKSLEEMMQEVEDDGSLD